MSTHPAMPEPTLDEFGARLALIRWRMGWNQKEAALATRVPHGSWREWELSGRAPRNLVEVAQKISEATGIPDYWIMTGKSLGGGSPGGGPGDSVTSGYRPKGGVVTRFDPPWGNPVHSVPMSPTVAAA